MAKAWVVLVKASSFRNVNMLLDNALRTLGNQYNLISTTDSHAPLDNYVNRDVESDYNAEESTNRVTHTKANHRSAANNNSKDAKNQNSDILRTILAIQKQ